jgi:hypothetical protein
MFGSAEKKECNMHRFNYGCWLLYYSGVLEKKKMRRREFGYFHAVFLCWLAAFLMLAV